MEVKNNDHIVELSSNFWPKLREKFVKDWPENQIGYFLVDDYIKWIKKDAIEYLKNVKFYTLNGEFVEDGTFVVVVRVKMFTNRSKLMMKFFRIVINYLFTH